VFEKFSQWQKNRHEYAQEWRARTGGKLLGYFCTYVPEELAYAAGVLPVRILGGHQPEDVSSRHIYAMYCPFCRDVLAQGLKGVYDYLDGITIAQSCLHIRQAFSSWQMHLPISYSYYLYHPMKVQSPRAVPYLAGELAKFKTSLEEWTGRTITQEALKESIDVYNTYRQLMTQLYETRKAETPPITGAEAMETVLASQLVDKAEINKELTRVLGELPQRKNNREAGIRLMLLGSEDDDIEFVAMTESLEATVVTDDHCTGTRYFLKEVSPNGDLLQALAQRYVDRIPCPSKDWEVRSRADHVLRLAQDYQVQGALLIQQKFCDPHECDIPPIKWLLEANGIPCLFLEFDVTTPAGQLRTRVEAFLETIRAEELF
jgi:benzoyl-CoA reductase subunit C